MMNELDLCLLRKVLLQFEGYSIEFYDEENIRSYTLWDLYDMTYADPIKAAKILHLKLGQSINCIHTILNNNEEKNDER